jgi:hypothetical protein
VLEEEAALLAVALAFHHDDGRHEPNHLEFFPQVVRIPDMAVLGFQCLTAAGFGVDL